MLRPFRYWLYYAVLVVAWATGAVGAILAYIAGQKSSEFTYKYIVETISWTQANHEIVLWLGLVATLSAFVCKMIGPPWARKAIKDLLDRFQRQIVSSLTGPVKSDDHRVTLFKRTSFISFQLRDWKGLPQASGATSWKDCQFPRGWFKPIERSRHTTLAGIARFPLFNRSSVGEGVAGIVWRSDGVQRIDGLPDLSPRGNRDAPIASYQIFAETAGVSVAFLKSRAKKTNARSFCGVPIEVGGSLWGVLIIDSRNETITVSDSQIEMVAFALGKLLERA